MGRYVTQADRQTEIDLPLDDRQRNTHRERERDEKENI